jgi:hypothetical protein
MSQFYVCLTSAQCVVPNRGNFCAANSTYALLLLSFFYYPPPIRNGAKITGHCPSTFIIVANPCLFPLLPSFLFGIHVTIMFYSKRGTVAESNDHIAISVAMILYPDFECELYGNKNDSQY